MQQFFDNLVQLVNNFQAAFIIGGCLLLIVASVGQWRLFEKAGQPGYAIFIPIYNVVVFLRIIGRPAWHILFFFIPIFNFYFYIKIMIETAESFGKRETIDYILAVVFNLLYVLNTGLAYDVKYAGPIYQTRKRASQDASNVSSSPRNTKKAQMAQTN